MKKSSILITIALAGAVFTQFSFAEDAAAPAAPANPPAEHGPHRSVEERLKMMTETLSLTDDQVAKLKPILAADQEKMKALHDDTALSKEDRRSKSHEIMQSEQEQVKGILTADQQAKWKEAMEKRRAAHEKEQAK